MTDDRPAELVDDFEELPEETDEEILAGLAESEDDIRAGRVRSAREAILEIAARYGLEADDTGGSDAALEWAEQVAKLRRSMADFEAGRYRPAKDVMREIAAEHGFAPEG